MSSRSLSQFSWRSLVPPLKWWHLVTPTTLKADLIAGLTGAIVVLPQGVAFATIAGMPPVYGLYAGMIPAIIAALFGSSWHLVSGPTTAASIVLYSLLSVHAEPGSAAYVQLALTMTFLVGLTQLGLGFIRLGVLVNFISHSVIIGFTSGAALLIASNQLKSFFGINIPRGSDFTDTWVYFVEHLKTINPYILTVSVATLLTGILFRRFFPRIPYMIIAMGVGSALAWVLESTLNTNTGITHVGALSASLPPLSMPDFSFSTLRILAPGVIAVTLLALTEALSIARAMALRSKQQIDADQEFIAQGVSNMVGSFFSAYVATGSFNRSGLNYEAGAKTPIAAASSGLMLIGLVTMVAPMASYLPHAAMAGVLFLVAWGLIDWQHMDQTLKTSHSETIILTTTFLATLFFSLEMAILFGIMLSLGIYLARTSNPNIITRVPDPTHPHRRFTIPDANLPECPQLRIERIDGSLFFAAIPAVQEHLANTNLKRPHLLIVASGVNFIDQAGAEFLAHEAQKYQNADGSLTIVRLKTVPYQFLKKGGYMDIIGEENCFSSKNDAIQHIFKQFNRDICTHCPHEVFQECKEVKIIKQRPNNILDLPNKAA
ncbi:MAG: SulP family inorganic anion transporter [Magnetococcus sp. DMHC-6]